MIWKGALGNPQLTVSNDETVFLAALLKICVRCFYYMDQFDVSPGDVLNQASIPLVLSPGHREDLRRIEKQTGCLLDNNYRRT